MTPGRFTFDSEGNMVSLDGGDVLVPSNVFDQIWPDIPRWRRAQHFRGSVEAANQGMVGLQQQQQQRPLPLGRSRSPSSTTTQPPNFIFTTPSSTTTGIASSSHSTGHASLRESLLFARNSSSLPASSTDSGGHHLHQARGPSHDLPHGLAIPDTNNPDAAPRAYAPSAQSLWVPQDFHSGSAALGFDDHNSAYPAADIAWLAQQSATEQQQQPSFVYEHSQQQPLPPRPRNPSTPVIRVTTDFAGAVQDFSQPQDAIYSASSASSLPPPGYNTYNSYNSGHLSPNRSPFMPQDSETMQTPVSPVSAQNSPHDTSMGEQTSRKRSHSEMSQPDVAAIAQATHSRCGSVVSANGASPNDASDDFFPKRLNSRAFKRGDPPVNEGGKYICDFSEECRGQTFDRKCEWSKHMDKHDRPYRCPHPSCAKLQGFTYSGGLLRHEREVHGKHGGPKAQLMCPHPDCKRHAGKGFTRKENLNEHLRRVHSTNGTQESQTSTLRRDATDVTLGAEDGETPASRASEPVETEDLATSPMLGKRKRENMFVPDPEVFEDMDSMRQELKRLRAEAQHKDERIRQMELDAVEQEEKNRHLENILMGMQQPPGQV